MQCDSFFHIHSSKGLFSIRTNMNSLLSDSFIKNPNIYMLPGVTPETIETCSHLLQENHEQYHIYFNHKTGFHNHTSHHLLVALGLGASSDTLKCI